MNLKLQAILAGIARDGLAVDPVLDWDLTQALSRACNDLLAPPPGPLASAFLPPCVVVGGVTLWRPTIGAKWFLRTRASAWVGPDDIRWGVLVAWSMANAKTPATLWAVSTEADLWIAVEQWIAGVAATEAEILGAIQSLIGNGSPSTAEDVTTRAAVSDEVLELLSREYGIDPGDAVWNRSEAEIAGLVESASERATREADTPSDPDSPRIRRIVAVQAAEAALRDAIKARGSNV